MVAHIDLEVLHGKGEGVHQDFQNTLSDIWITCGQGHAHTSISMEGLFGRLRRSDKGHVGGYYLVP